MNKKTTKTKIKIMFNTDSGTLGSACALDLSAGQ